jgi:thiosulfate/3-mercaptopyruvate sulfurtransferase
MRARTLALFAALVWPAAGGAQEHPAHQERMAHNRHLLATAEWLAARLDSGIIVVHVGRTDSLYRVGHVPGARFLALGAVATTVGGVANEFPPPEHLIETLRTLGIGDSARIVLYGDDAGLFAARAWTALDLLGHGDRAALLDGGLAAWRTAGHRLESGAATTAPRPFSGTWHAQRIVDADWVRAHLGDGTVLFVDARPADQFGGSEAPCPPAQTGCVEIPAGRRGHLPGAVNVFWMSALVSRDRPALKAMHELHHTVWEPAGGDRPHVRTIVAYCRTGFQASHTYWQARYIGYPDVRLFDASFLVWALGPADRNPVEAGAP